MIRLPRLMDAGMQEIARVRPVKLAYKIALAPISTAVLTVLQSDVNASLVHFAELFDAHGSLGVFRVASIKQSYNDVPTHVFALEHAITTLSADKLVGYHEFGGAGVSMADTLAALMAFQKGGYWQLGDVDFSTQLQYSFENDGLLTALVSVPVPLTEEYFWTFDFSTSPWTVSLKSPDDAQVCEIRLARNASKVDVDIDRTALCTRLYPLGYGEGVNQLGIKSVNGNVPYVEDSAAQTIWGVIDDVYADTTITDAQTLLAVANATLAVRKTPTISITASAHDIYAATGEPLDALLVGRKCRVPLLAYGITFEGRVLEVAKSDVFGNPEKVTITLSNRQSDAASAIASLGRKAAINSLYSQGATNQYGVHFADNADAENPAELAFYVDPGAVQINSVMCRYKLEEFRGYSKGAAAGSGSPTTSSSGGATTTASGGGGDSTQTSGGGGSQGSSFVTDLATSGTPIETGSTDDNQYTDYGGAAGGSHRHFYGHRHRTSVGITVPAIPSHTHSVTIPSHTHSVTVPGHTHTVDIANHTHNALLGIYKGSKATAVTIKVDGTTVPSGSISGGEFDAVPYLAKDANGRITRGTWHTITVTPNSNTRIIADVHVKTFVRSISGGNY